MTTRTVRPNPLAICVYCASASSIDESYLELARRVGEQIGKRGHRLVSGGGRVSMMGAVASAARAYGAHTTGVIPQHLLALEVADAAADDLLVVDTMRERKALMDAKADAFLVLPGGIGTLEEFFEVWTSATLGMHRKPVVVLDESSFFRPLWTAIETMAAAGFVRPGVWDSLHRVSSVEAAFDVIEAGV
ncbi:MAG: hypothetical protein JWN95_1591 [Frankiales bacterium]|nr:hypothetical protein [Frankiales bacterium]